MLLESLMTLTHCCRDKIDFFLQKTFSNSVYCAKLLIIIIIIIVIVIVIVIIIIIIIFVIVIVIIIIQNFT